MNPTKIKKRKLLLADWVDNSVKMLTLMVAAFGIWQFFADRADTKLRDARSQTLTYIEQFGSDRLLDAQGALDAFWLSPNGQIFVASTTPGAPINPRSYAVFVDSQYPVYANRAELRAALLQFERFFDRVWFCREAGICETAMLDNYFCPVVTRHQTLYAPFYTAMGREFGTASLGDGQARYAGVCNAATPSE